MTEHNKLMAKYHERLKAAKNSSVEAQANETASKPMNPFRKAQTTEELTEAPTAAKQNSTSYNFESIRQFNSSNEFVRFTTEVVPNLTTFSKVDFPIACFLKPLGSSAVAIPIVNAKVDRSREDPDADNVPRCDNCKAFVNPFFEFQPGRKTYKCNLCQQVQPTPRQYQDPYGDFSSSELSLGSYEFFASARYFARTPKEPSYAFLIDVSLSSTQSNVPFYAIAAIKEAVRGSRFNGGRSVSLAIAFFDTKLHLVRPRTNGRILLQTVPFSLEPSSIPLAVN